VRDLPEGWNQGSLGQLFKTTTGSTPSKREQHYYGDDIPFVKPPELSNDFIYETADNLSNEGASIARILPSNSILVSCIGNLGKVGINTTPVAFNQQINSILPDQKAIPKFMFYQALSPAFIEQLHSLASGTTVPIVNKSKFNSINIALPSLPAQKRIVALLDEAFAGISQAVANAEKNLANARELFESYLNNIFTQKGDGWVERKIGDAELLQIIDGDRGVNYPKKVDFLNEGFCLFLNTKNVRPDGFNFDTTMFITEEKDQVLRKGKLKRRDVLLTTRGTIGNIALYDESVVFNEIRINSGMLIFRPNEQVILSEYLFEILRSGIMKFQIERFVSGAAQPQLPIKTLVNFTIPVPTELVDQKEIVTRLHDLLSETKQLERVYQQKINALAELKQSILQKAFNGELTADAARKQVN
jgi:type I restriction enzyme S subunit